MKQHSNKPTDTGSSRRQFIRNTSLTIGSLWLTNNLLGSSKEPV